MRESPIEITLTVQLVLTIDPTEQYPLATISEVLVKQNITSLLVESLVECLNDRLVESFCGEKHARGNGNRRFQRSARCTRSAETTAGEHTFTLDYVEDTAASDDEQSHFRPVEKLIQFAGKKRYQEDISAKAIDRATTLLYRDAVSAGDGSKMPSPDTIQRRVKEYGKKLSSFVSAHISGTETDTVIPDGTKCHSRYSYEDLANPTTHAHEYNCSGRLNSMRKFGETTRQQPNAASSRAARRETSCAELWLCGGANTR
jgi:hypothetical protein